MNYLPYFSEIKQNGCHLKIRLMKEGQNIMGDNEDQHGISLPAQNFIKGIQETLGIQMAFLSS